MPYEILNLPFDLQKKNGMDTIEAKKKRKREQDRESQRRCRAKKKKLKEELKKIKEDLLIKNYKNREAVRKHRSAIKHAGTRGKYKPRKTQYDTRKMKKIRYTDKNILQHPQLLGLSTTPIKKIIIQTKDGQQKIIHSNRARTEYVGDTVNGKPHGKGTKYDSHILDNSKEYVEETYVGDFKNGKEHGNGKLTDNDGWSYDGQWKNGKYHGEGIRQIQDGIIIKGNWKKSSMYGKCTISIPKRCAKFEASFIWGWPKAYKKSISIDKYSYSQFENCTLSVTDSDSYYVRDYSDFMTGIFVSKGDFIFKSNDNFFMHGMVEQTFEDGRRYSGMFSRDYYHGLGTYTWPDDYTFSTLLKDHDIKLKKLSGRFENGYFVEGKLKLNIGNSTASIDFEGVKYNLRKLARDAIDWSLNFPKLTGKANNLNKLLEKRIQQEEVRNEEKKQNC